MADVAQLLETLHAMREPPAPTPVVPFLAMAMIGVASAATIAVAAWLVRQRGGAVRRAAAAALAASRAAAPGERLAAQAQLLRRLVRGLDGDDAAQAQGSAWLERLDQTFATRFFTQGEGVAYGDDLYSRQPNADVAALDRSLAGLIAKVRA